MEMPPNSLLNDAVAAENVFLREVLRRTPAGLAILTGPEHRLTYFNERFQEHMSGRARLGEPAAMCLPEVMAQGFADVLGHVYRTGEPITSHGSPIDLLDPKTHKPILRYYDLTFLAMRDAHGQVESVLACAAEATAQVLARQATERRLAEQRTFYDTLLKEAPVALVAFDADHRYLYANLAMVEQPDFAAWVLGKTSAEACARRGFPPALAAQRQKCFDEALRKRSEVTWEESVPNVLGTRHWLRRMRPVFYADGSLHFVVSSGLDITERRRAEEELRQQQRVTQRIVDALPQPLSVTEAGGKVIFANAAQRMLRRATKRRWRRSSPAEPRVPELEQLGRLHAQVLTGDQDAAADLEVVLDSGEVQHYHVVLRPLAQADGGVHVLTVANDVTSLLRAQRAATAAARAQESFLATMSHEIRTPLNGMLGMAGLLAKTPLAPEQQRYLTAMQYAGRHLLALLNDVLDMAKIQVGKLHLETVAVNLDHTLRQAAHTLGESAAEKGLVLVTEGFAAPPPAVHTDPVRLSQVLLNLLSNAIKFTDTGQVTLHANRRAETATHLTVHFCVRDTGPGLAPEAQEHIFDAFAQASADTTRRHGGTGLGLAISSRLVAQLGGHLVVCSVPGAGSVFGFTVAFEKAPAPAAAPREPAPGGAAGALRGRRVLLVDDNALNLELAQAVLAQNGLVVDAAPGGQLALALFEQHRYDVVLMDVHMPGMSGLEATARIRQHPDPARAATPVIALTADAFRAQHEGYRAAGMTDVLTKPFTEAALLAKLVSVSRPQPDHALRDQP